jgi:AcrR family transcriptional regulator
MNTVENKKRAILDATLRLISKYGFHGTAMSKIAKEAGVSAGIIYHYFENKDDLMDEVYRDVKRLFGQTLAAEFDDTQPITVQVRQILSLMLRYYIARPLESAFLEQYVRSPYFNKDIEAEMAQHYRPMLICLKRAQEERVIKTLPDAVLLAFTLDVATSLAQRQATGSLTLDETMIEQVIEASWQAIRA